MCKATATKKKEIFFFFGGGVREESLLQPVLRSRILSRFRPKNVIKQKINLALKSFL